jgi:hypothetical protein
MVTKRTTTSLLAAAGLLAAAMVPAAHAQMTAPMPGAPPAELYTNAPQANPGDDPANWSARQNVADSQRYEHMVRTNASFRAARIRKECGSINEPGLFQQCVSSFE